MIVASQGPLGRPLKSREKTRQAPGPLGPSWAALGPSWGPLGPSWGGLGGLLDRLRASGSRKGEKAKIIQKLIGNQRFYLSGPSPGGLFGGLLGRFGG